MVLDSAADILLTGSSDLDIYTAKYSGTDGRLIWEKRFDGQEHDEGLALTLDGAGNPIITGRSYNNSSYDIYTAKYAQSDGALVWETRFNGPENADDIPSGIVIDAAGNVFVGGSSATNLYVAGYRASDGGLLWEKKVEGHGSYSHQVNSLVLDATGDVIVAGALTNQYVTKLSGITGATIWERRMGSTPLGILRDVVIDSNGDAIVTGDLADDFYTAKYAATDGATRWEKTYNGPAKGVDIPVTTAIDSSGNVVVFGSSNHDFHTVKYEGTGSGRTLWERRYDGPDSLWDEPAAMTLDASANVIVAGSTQFQMPGIRPSAIYLAKYAASSGAVLWEKRIIRSALPVSAGVAGITLDENGNVIITATMSDVPIGQDIYTAKLSAADGSLLWERIYAGPFFDYAKGLALDPSGNAIVIGSSGTSTGKYEPYTAKYAAATGALLWERRLTNAVRIDFGGTDLGGNLIAAGKTGTQFFGNYLSKFDAATGSLLWERSSTNISEANGFKVAPSGNIYMTALTRTNIPTDIPPYFPNSLNSIVVQEYSGDGALLWETKYGTTTNIQSFVSTIALDSSENVIVTGGTRKSDGKPHESFISKFSGVNGALLWELKRPEYVPSSVALNAQGAIAIAGNSTVDYLTILYRDEASPALNISRNLGNLLQLSWPAAYAGWRLETQSESSGIRPAGNWTPVPMPSGTNAVILPIEPSKGASFFRLARP